MKKARPFFVVSLSLKRAYQGLVSVALALASVVSVANAQLCNAGLDTTATVIRDGANRPVGAIISNNSTECSHLVGLASYRVVSDLPQDHIETQVIFDARQQVLAPGETVNWIIQVPDCAYQIDAVRGPVLQTFRGGQRYSGRKFFAFLENMTNLCPPPNCEEARVRDIVGSIIPSEGNPSCGRLINYSSECVYPVGVASYALLDAPPVIENQQLYDSASAELSPGGETDLCVDIPQCAYQLYVYEGQVVQSFANGERYGSRLRDAGVYLSDSNPLCVPPTPTPTPTPNPTVTSTPTVTPTATPTTTPLPLLECSAVGPESAVACPTEGNAVSVSLSGVGSSVGSGFTYAWTSNCAGGVLSNADSLFATLSVPLTQLTGPSLSCSSTLTVTRTADGATAECPVPVQLSACPTDCLGTINGTAVRDRCGECAGDGSSCVLTCTGEEQRDRQILIDNLAAELRARVARIYRLSARAERSAAERTARLKELSQANTLYSSAWRTGWSLPSVVLTCSNAAVCNANSLAGQIESYRSSVAELLKVGERGANRLRSRQSARLRAQIRAEFRRLRNTYKNAVNAANEIPSSSFVCP